VQIGLVHGKLKPAEKAAVMAAFKAGELQLLVATTVIEVGVDVPNASLMIIDNAERLGLAQLHQLRGRVGRGAVDSHCLLLYRQPLSGTAQQRLKVMQESNDGFVIAEADLAIRGPGELLGTRQTGLAAFRIALLPEHEPLLVEAQEIAGRLYERDPGSRAGSDAKVGRCPGRLRQSLITPCRIPPRRPLDCAAASHECIPLSELSPSLNPSGASSKWRACARDHALRQTDRHLSVSGSDTLGYCTGQRGFPESAAARHLLGRYRGHAGGGVYCQ
jgi:hypothetical protein